MCSLLVTSHLLDMVHSCLGTFHYLDKLPHFTSQKFLKMHITIIDGLGYKFLIMQEKPKNFTMEDLCCFWGGYLARLTWACTALYYSSILLLPCQKLASRSKEVQASLVCGLQNSSYFPQIVSRLRSSFDKPKDTYWSTPKSQLEAITF